MAQAMSALEVAKIQSVFAAAPDCAEFSEPIIAVVLDRDASTLQTWRSRGTGPTFQKGGKSVLYRKADVVSWRNEHFVSASNGAQAKAKRKAASND